MEVPPIFAAPQGAIGIAHRGSRLLWPENTATAFKGAADLGYRCFETDLRITADGVLVCFHDPFLSRTTNGNGQLARATFDQVRRLDAGFRHRLNDGFPYRGRGIVVPTFAEMATTFPEAGWVLDLKADGTEEPLAALIKEVGLADRVIVGSFAHERVDRFRHLTAGRVATSTPPRETLRAMFAAASSLRISRQRKMEGAGPKALRFDVFDPTTCALQVPATWYGVPVVSRKLVTLAHAAERLVHVWTVNSMDEVAALIELGVDGLITDRPDLVSP